MDSVKIEVELTVEDVKCLNDELDCCNSSFMTELIEHILKQVTKKSNQMLRLAYDIKDNNQFDNWSEE